MMAFAILVCWPVCIGCQLYGAVSLSNFSSGPTAVSCGNRHSTNVRYVNRWVTAWTTMCSSSDKSLTLLCPLSHFHGPQASAQGGWQRGQLPPPGQTAYAQVPEILAAPLKVMMCDGWRGFILLGSVLLHFESEYKNGSQIANETRVCSIMANTSSASLPQLWPWPCTPPLWWWACLFLLHIGHLPLS